MIRTIAVLLCSGAVFSVFVPAVLGSPTPTGTAGTPAEVDEPSRLTRGQKKNIRRRLKRQSAREVDIQEEEDECDHAASSAVQTQTCAVQTTEWESVATETQTFAGDRIDGMVISIIEGGDSSGYSFLANGGACGAATSSTAVQTTEWESVATETQTFVGDRIDSMVISIIEGGDSSGYSFLANGGACGAATSSTAVQTTEWESVGEDSSGYSFLVNGGACGAATSSTAVQTCDECESVYDGLFMRMEQASERAERASMSMEDARK